MPIEIICGAEDKIVDVERQSRRLSKEITHSRLTVIPNAGHMFHHTYPAPLLRLIDDAVEAGQLPAAA